MKNNFKELEKRTGVPTEVWHSLAKSAKIDAEETGVMVTTADQVNGCITLSEAARKYNLAQPTLWRWATMGLIKIIVPARAQGSRTWVDEESVRKAVEFYKSNHAGQGSQTMRKFVPQPASKQG